MGDPIPTDERPRRAARILEGFAVRTGLLPGDGDPNRRYLWTDAFAVFAALGLWRRTGEGRWLDLATNLVEWVHEVLGRHRSDSGRHGWISGLGEAEGREHPTAGGLRIGKPLPERRPEEPYDERLEWEREGQYFHYLTKWMQALARMALATGEVRYLRWGRELARAAHRGFVVRDPAGGPPRMVWKASVDLSRALVPSMGQHDPLDGWVSVLELDHVAQRLGEDGGVDLAPRRSDFEAMLLQQVAHGGLGTSDPLGAGGLLTDASAATRLLAAGTALPSGLLPALWTASRDSTAAVLASRQLEGPAERRLGFRELGLAIGLEAVPQARDAWARAPALDPEVGTLLDTMLRVLPVADHVVAFWTDPAHRASSTWQDHLDIDEVMLAVALLPDAYVSFP